MSARVAAGLLLPLLLAPAAGAGAHQDRSREPSLRLGPGHGDRAEALEALGRWDVPAARAALARLGAGDDAADPLPGSLAAFYEGDYEEAARLLAGRPPGTGADPLRRLVEDSLEMRRRLATRESEHFTLWYDAGRDWVLAQPALEALEASRNAAGEWLGHWPERRVRVEIAPTAEDFERVTGLGKHEIETAGAVAICKFNKIVILSPRLLLRGYPWRDTLGHEYLHYVLVRLSGNRAPIWLQEGVARYGESRWRAGGGDFLDDVDRGLLARALAEGSLIAFEAMDPSLVSLPTAGAVRLAFAQCALAVEHILGRWGVPGLRALLGALGGDAGRAGTDAALREALGLTLGRLEADLRAALADRGFVRVPGLAIPSHRLAGEGDAERWDLEEWQPLEARNHLRLGDLLRARGHARAALREYGKALDAAPASPYVRVKLARALADLGHLGEAVAAAREGARLAPDYPAAQDALAAALAALGEWEGAAAALARSLEINPFNHHAWRGLGLAEARLGRDQRSREALETARRLEPPEVRGRGAGEGSP